MSGPQKNGGSAFPLSMETMSDCEGITLRDWFASGAPVPTSDEITFQHQADRNRNPHSDAHKPALRSRREVIASLAFEYADAMLAERQKP